MKISIDLIHKGFKTIISQSSHTKTVSIKYYCPIYFEKSSESCFKSFREGINWFAMLSSPICVISSHLNWLFSCENICWIYWAKRNDSPCKFGLFVLINWLIISIPLFLMPKQLNKQLNFWDFVKFTKRSLAKEIWGIVILR